MKQLVTIIVVLLALVPLTGADRRPEIRSIVDREYVVEDHWAGQSFTLVEKGEEMQMIWKIFGSGVPVVSEVNIPVTIQSNYQVIAKFMEESSQCPREIKVTIDEEGEVRAFVDGIRICIHGRET